jgi:hypothetical protein
MASLSGAQFGNLGEEQHPVPVAHDRGRPGSQDDATIDRMAGRIVKTYLAATPQAHHLGETFYGHDAFGAADAIARGHDPNGRVGRLFRRAPVGAKGTPEDNVRAHMPAEHQEALHAAAGTIARLSPQTEWQTNVRQAHEAYQMAGGQHAQAEYNLRNDVRDTSRKPNPKTGELARTEVRGDSGEKLALNKQKSDTILKAVDIARGTAAPEEHVAMGEDTRVKIGSFANNVEHPETSPYTTVDFRAHDIASGKLRSTGTDRAISKSGPAPKPGKAPTVAHTQRQRYLMMEEAHSRAANIINEQHPEHRHQAGPLQPKQVQAVTWWADKIHQDNALGGVAQGGHLHGGEDGGVLKRESLGRPLGQ